MRKKRFKDLTTGDNVYILEFLKPDTYTAITDFIINGQTDLYKLYTVKIENMYVSDEEYCWVYDMTINGNKSGYYLDDEVIKETAFPIFPNKIAFSDISAIKQVFKKCHANINQVISKITQQFS